MSANTKPDHMQILQDPVTVYAKLYPDSPDESVSRMGMLEQEIKNLKPLQKQTQEKCKEISRSIGQAKRNGDPVDDLKVLMQEQSTILKSVKTKIAKIETDILAFFNSDPIHTKAAQSAYASVKSRDHTTTLPYDINTVSVSLLNNEHNKWNDYVDHNPAATIYHRTEWCELIQRTHKHKGLYFAAHDTDHNIIGILPLIHLNSHLFGNFMVSMPYFNYGGAIADHPLIEQQLMSAANTYAERADISHIEYRDDISRQGPPVRTDKVNMILDLPEQNKELWSQFTSKLRAQIRRPQKEQPNIKLGKEELIDDFYTVFARNMRDLGTPVYGKAFFSHILQSFTKHCKIIIVYMEDRPVAAAFLLGYKDTLEIPWASTINDVNHLSMNMLLYWEALKFAIENQYRHFDFGRSSKDSGTFRFKQQWGAKPKQLYWHYWLSDNAELPKLNPDNPKYALLISLWKRLPIIITKWFGPYIVRNLP